MRTAFNVIGALLVVAGGVWLLQGIGVLPGSFMTGQTRWATYGLIAIVAGAGFLILARRRRA
jgi:hypothetical protein